MGYTETFLEEVRERHKADAAVLAEARWRRDAVTGRAQAYPGALRTFNSGSIAHETVNDPVVDADAGVVLDRRSCPALGPDESGEGPTATVRSMADWVATGLSTRYPSLTVEVTKRAILVAFHEPMDVAGSAVPRQDPSVDLIVALTRASGSGIWIPNTEEDDWDASDPERHTELFRQGDPELRRNRRRAIRLSKLLHRQFGGEPAVSSFNQEAIGHAVVVDGMSIAEAFLAICERGASQLSAGLTPDPAGVSQPIKCPGRLLAAERYAEAGRHVSQALARDADEAYVRAEVEAVFYLLEPPSMASKSGFAAALRQGVPLGFGAAGLGLRPSDDGAPPQPAARPVALKTTRAYGSAPPAP